MGRNKRKKRKEDIFKEIDEALNEAKNQKQEAEAEIDKIQSWMAEAIIETFENVFPNGHLTYYREKYKDNAVSNYEQIKKENADKVNPEKIEKCDKIVIAYKNQIGLRESKVKLYQKLVNNYEKTRSKIQETELKEIEKGKVDKHEQRLKELDALEDDYVDAFTDTAQMEELVGEFEAKAEYAKQLSLLNEKYKESDVDDFTTSSAFKDEIDKLINEID
jgi:hypothetical protein